jgi:predicted N-acyltransferase
LFCGLPVSAGQKTLAVIPRADRAKVLEAIDAALCGLARQLRVRLIVWKEFGPEDCCWLAPLKNRGYIQADSLPMNCFEARFATFDAYLASLKKHRRRNIARSQRKLHDAGLRVVRMRGDDGFDRLYTDGVHQLYEAVLAHSESRLEQLPAEFFRAIARHFGKDAYFTILYEGERIVSFLCSLADAQQFAMLFLGMDYARNQECDLYFNVVYDALDSALRSGAPDIFVGQNSPHFKSRLGCYQEPRVFFIKGGGVLRLPLRWFARLLFPPMEPLPRTLGPPSSQDPIEPLPSSQQAEDRPE